MSNCENKHIYLSRAIKFKNSLLKQQCYWLQQAHSHLHGWRIWAKLRATFELRDIKPTIKMSRKKQRKRSGVRNRTEANMKFLQETKERIQHRNRGLGEVIATWKAGTGPSCVTPPAVMDYIPDPAFLLHLHFQSFYTQEKTDEIQVKFISNTHRDSSTLRFLKQNHSIQRRASYLKVVPLYQGRKQHRWESPNCICFTKCERQEKIKSE